MQATGSAQRAGARDSERAANQLTQTLLAGRNADGGWGYYAGKVSRLEPTCWALLALRAHGAQAASLDPAYAWLAQCERSSGWLVENPEWPVNIAYNALAAFTLRDHPAPPARETELQQRLLASLIASKGLTAPQADHTKQDNSLQGWSWIDQTFSWVEPTCWGLLALKKARGSGTVNAAALAARIKVDDAALAARITEGERLLADRVCRNGGWNFGNATVMQQDLRPYVPVTALGLLAMQDLRGADVVARSLAALETLWPTEISAVSLGLSLICLSVYDRPADPLAAQLAEHAAQALAFGNHHGIAVALFALSQPKQSHAFTL